MPPNIIYQIKALNTKSGHWDTLFNFPNYQYNEAYKAFYNQYKKDNSRQYQFIQVKEELIDSLYPPNS